MMIFGVILSWGRGLNGGRGQKDGRGQTHPHVKFELALGEGCLKVQVFAAPANFGGTTWSLLSPPYSQKFRGGKYFRLAGLCFFLGLSQNSNVVVVVVPPTVT